MLSFFFTWPIQIYNENEWTMIRSPRHLMTLPSDPHWWVNNHILNFCLRGKSNCEMLNRKILFNVHKNKVSVIRAGIGWLTYNSWLVQFHLSISVPRASFLRGSAPGSVLLFPPAFLSSCFSMILALLAYESATSLCNRNVVFRVETNRISREKEQSNKPLPFHPLHLQ